MDQPLAYTIAEACRALRIGRTKLYSLIGDGKLRARKNGRRTIIMYDDLRRLLDALPEIRSKARPHEGQGS